MSYSKNHKVINQLFCNDVLLPLCLFPDKYGHKLISRSLFDILLTAASINLGMLKYKNDPCVFLFFPFWDFGRGGINFQLKP